MMDASSFLVLLNRYLSEMRNCSPICHPVLDAGSRGAQSAPFKHNGLDSRLRGNDRYVVTEISKEQRQKLADYLALLQKWNAVYNLTAVKNPKDMVLLHILDSLSVRDYVQGESIVDVGTGAGLPGIPLAIIFPEKCFVLLDSNGKKTRFLTQVVASLGLRNVSIVHSRVEDYVGDRIFSTVITRAFSSVHDMLQLTKHLAGEKTLFLAMKGKFPAQELESLPKGFSVQFQESLSVPHLTAERHVIGIVYEG